MKVELTRAEISTLALLCSFEKDDPEITRDEHNTLCSFESLLNSLAETGERDSADCVVTERNL